MNSAESADEVVKMYLQGVEVALKISGEGAKNIIAMLYAMQKDKTKISGKTKLANMLKSQSTLKVFSIQKKDLKTFSKEAKKYGILYTLLAKKKGKDPNELVDILVKEEDAPRINRLVDKFSLATYNKTKIEHELETSRAEKDKAGDVQNPSQGMTEKSNLSKSSSKDKKSSNKTSKNREMKPSVRKKLKEIKAKQNLHEEKFKNKEKQKQSKHIPPKKKKTKTMKKEIR